MAKETSGASGASVGPILGSAAVGAALVAAAVAYVLLREPDEPAPLPADMTTEGATEAPATLDATAPAAEDVPAPDADTTAPRFDVVRVDASGSAVIAGQAGAGARVTLKLHGDAVETVEADGGGSFVAMLALSPSEMPRILSLEAALPGGAPVPGAATVMIAPFAGTAMAEATPPEPPPAQSADRPGIGEASSTSPSAPAAEDGAAVIADLPAPSTAVPGSPPEADIATADLPAAPSGTPAPPEPAAPSADVEAPDAAAPPTAPDAAPQAPAVLMADADGVRVLQAPGAAPIAQTEIRLDAITYDVTGDVTLAGRGPAEASVRVTLNNQPINMGEIGPGGQWSLGLPDVDPGTYTLRLEQLAADGTVTRTVTTPFLREDPARIRANPMLVDPGASVITVQRGFTLWGIAEANFGEGILYVQIFEENRGEIRDPDLIFPGQIFALPDLPRTGGAD